MPKVLVDFEDVSDKGGFAPYVGVSRVQRREDLAIMRPVALPMLNRPLPAGLGDLLKKLHAMASNSLIINGFQDGSITPIEVEATEEEVLQASYKPGTLSQTTTGKRKNGSKSKDNSNKRQRTAQPNTRANAGQSKQRQSARVASEPQRARSSKSLANRDPGNGSSTSASRHTQVLASRPLSTQVRPNTTAHTRLPGCSWDSSNYSCAYDSLLMILVYTLREASTPWRANFTRDSSVASQVDTLAQSLNLGAICSPDCQYSTCLGRALDRVREAWRNSVSTQQPASFPRSGPVSVAVDKLADWTLYSAFDWEIGLSTQVSCDAPACTLELGPQDTQTRLRFPHTVASTANITVSSASPWRLDDYVTRFLQAPLSESSIQEHHRLSCHGSAHRQAVADQLPACICINGPYFNPDAMQVTPQIILPAQDGDAPYNLRGVIYHGSGHFTCRFSSDDAWWTYDGIPNGGHAIREGDLDLLVRHPKHFETLDGRRAYKYIYALAC